MFELVTVKTITLTSEAYDRLRALKREGESFSETIVRVTNRPPLMSFFGTLPPDSGHELAKVIEQNRTARRSIDRQR